LAIDITARKKAEVQAAESAERYRALAAATREGIIIHDSTRIIEVNEIFCRLHGTTRERAVGRPAHAFLSPRVGASRSRRSHWTRRSPTK